MTERIRRGRRALSNILLASGLLILLAVAAYFGWNQIQAGQVRAALAQNPPSTPVVRLAEATSTPSPAPRLPTATPTQPPAPATATATALPPAAPPTATLAPARATDAPASPIPQPTATRPAPRPAATAAPAAAAGLPVRLVIPDLGVDTRVVPMGWEVIQTANGPRSEWVIPKNEAGHHINSALLGQNDNLVISGHNNIYGMVFKPISLAWDNDRRVQVDSYTDRSDILNGRTITLYDAAGQSYQYTVTDFLRLKDTGVPAAQRIANARFMQSTGAAQLTIITCWPPTNNTHRLIVIAHPAQ